MDDVRVEGPDSPYQMSHHLDLLHRFSKPRLIEHMQVDRIAQQVRIWLSFFLGEETQHLCVRALGDPTRKPNAIFTKVESDKRNLHIFFPLLSNSQHGLSYKSRK